MYFSATPSCPPFVPPGQSTDNYAMAATTEWQLKGGTYDLRVAHDDGVKVFIDGKLVLESGSVGTTTEHVKLTAESHRIKVEYAQINGSAWLMFWLRRTGP